jgi:transposase-like protein
MPQHFLLTAAARTLTLASVARMTDEEAEAIFRKIRWASNNGDPFCPKCGCAICYDCRRANGTARWRCKACLHSFSITSGTLFHSRKMPLRSYLMAIAIFANEVKGKSMLAMSRDLGVAYQTSFVLAHKMREAMAAEVRQTAIGGEGKRAEIDGGYFGGYVKPANRREDRRDRRKRLNQTGKRKVVVVIRERGENGKTLPGVFRSEVEALNFIRRQVPRNTRLYADESSAWNELHARYELHRINHEEAYSIPEQEIYTNNAESFFSRMRRGEIGHHHHVAGPYLIRFAQEAAWREDHRRDANGSQVDRIVALVMRNKPSIDFCGYWQRRRAA